ncbi:hypothetical protein ACFSLT_01345 [Novosphingobium resinovorum]
MLRFLHRLLEAGLHFERRFDPFFRPALDAVVRMPLTRFFNWTINVTRSRDVPPLAQGRIDPDEDISLDTIIAEMQHHLDLDFTPALTNARATPRPTASSGRLSRYCRACPSTCAGASSRRSAAFPHGSASPTPAPMSSPTSTTSASAR